MERELAGCEELTDELYLRAKRMGFLDQVIRQLSGKEIKQRYTDRIASRILGDFKPFLFAGTDIRRLKLNEKA